ncbi:MAG: polysaccharide pyruvyl transferase family protein [Eubacterium sp.]|nr:polysaccharide pyruvyl transferase family protein [Eubacterium sp.]
MRVGVLSRHSVANYGSLWQAYALQTVIEQLGCEAININYTPEKEVGGTLAKTLVNVSRWGKKSVTRLAFLAYQYPSFTHTFSTFRRYRKLYLKETKEYTSSEQLKRDLPKVDLFCTGSDQVWNLLYDNKIDDTYFFDFLPDDKRRIAYAASFGGNKFEDGNVEKYANYLKKYDSISVREDSGVQILKQFGINGMQVLDPTLLLSKEEWEKLLPDKQKKEDYILIYQLRPNKEFDNFAVELSKKTGMKLIRISTMFFQKFKCGEFHYLPKPEEFLWYIKNAKCLLTDSFHGTCFAINFETQFIEILPGRFNARNQSLLKAMGVEDRILTDYHDFSLYDKKIDWGNVDEIHTSKKEQSMEILKEMIERKEE